MDSFTRAWKYHGMAVENTVMCLGAMEDYASVMEAFNFHCQDHMDNVILFARRAARYGMRVMGVKAIKSTETVNLLKPLPRKHARVIVYTTLASGVMEEVRCKAS